jgi:hypothetical protein
MWSILYADMQMTPARSCELRHRPEPIVLGKIDGVSCFIAFTLFLPVVPTRAPSQKSSENDEAIYHWLFAAFRHTSPLLERREYGALAVCTPVFSGEKRVLPYHHLFVSE